MKNIINQNGQELNVKTPMVTKKKKVAEASSESLRVYPCGQDAALTMEMDKRDPVDFGHPDMFELSGPVSQDKPQELKAHVESRQGVEKSPYAILVYLSGRFIKVTKQLIKGTMERTCLIFLSSR